MSRVSRALRRASGALTIVAALALAPPIAVPADAASSAGCEGGGFVIRGLNDRSTIGSDGKVTIPADNLGPSLVIDGRYVEFAVVSETFAVEDWTLTGEPNPLDITGNRRTVVFDTKRPDLRGLILTGDVTVERKGIDIVLSRQGPGLTMKIQAKDCASGGVFQMEVARDDATATRFTHVLAEGIFYFDNPNFRAREGDVVPFNDTTVTRDSAHQLRQRFVSSVRRPGQPAGRHPRAGAGVCEPDRHSDGRHGDGAPLRSHLALGRGERRPHGPGDGRGRR